MHIIYIYIYIYIRNDEKHVRTITKNQKGNSKSVTLSLSLSLSLSLLTIFVFVVQLIRGIQISNSVSFSQRLFKSVLVNKLLCLGTNTLLCVSVSFFNGKITAGSDQYLRPSNIRISPFARDRTVGVTVFVLENGFDIPSSNLNQDCLCLPLC